MDNTWGTHLKADPIPWLLEPENPSVRYWTLTDLLDQPADDPEVQDARVAIAREPLVQEILASQHPNGHWGDDEPKPYTAQGVVGMLSVLHMLGVDPDERTAAGCDSLLRFSQNENGGFSLRKTQRSGIFPCTTGEHLPALIYFGLGDDPRVRRAFAFVVEDMARQDALDCGRYQHQDCLWGAIAALNGLTVLPEDMRSTQSEQVVRCLVDALLDAEYDFEGEHKRWLTFGVPRAWDLLSALQAVSMHPEPSRREHPELSRGEYPEPRRREAAHGYAHDPRFTSLLDLVLARQDEAGRWPCGSVSRTWPLERRNRPSKWVTLDALRLLKRIAGENGN